MSLGELTWPTNVSADVQSFQFPDDGSIVSLGRSRALVSAQTGEAATAQAVAEVVGLTLFGGELTAAQVAASTTAGASQRSAGADVSASAVLGLRALGQDARDVAGLDGLARRLGSRLGPVGAERQPSRESARRAGERSWRSA